MKLTLVRGLPGSGKSTFAQSRIGIANPNARLFENDQYFIDDKGRYNFNIKEILNAAHYCWQRTAQQLMQGGDAIVANTFVTKRYIMPYIHLGVQMDAKIEIVLCECNYTSIHEVPDKVIDKMKLAWEAFTLDELLIEL
jgi:predicted kinase